MRAKRMKMGGAEGFEHVQKPATAIQDHVSSPNSIYKVRQACTFETKNIWSDLDPNCLALKFRYCCIFF